MNSINETIGNNISKYRKSFNLTQLELAENLNYSDKAVSKWERGESIPDVSTLMQIAKFFNITLNDICYENKQKSHAFSSNLKKYKHTYISVLSVGLCWLIATIVYTLFLVFAPEIKMTWLAFIYAIPVSAILLVVFNSIWGKRFYNLIYVSLLFWGITLCICLTVLNSQIFYLFLIGIPLQILTIIWYFFKERILEKIKIKHHHQN